VVDSLMTRAARTEQDEILWPWRLNSKSPSRTGWGFCLCVVKEREK